MATLCLIGFPDFTSVATFFRNADLLGLLISGILRSPFNVLKDNIDVLFKPTQPRVALLTQDAPISFWYLVVYAHFAGFLATNFAWL